MARIIMIYNYVKIDPYFEYLIKLAVTNRKRITCRMYNISIIKTWKKTTTIGIAQFGGDFRHRSKREIIHILVINILI